MALLSALLSLVSRRLGDLVQALFGWSVTALFARQSSGRLAALSVALALSVPWSLFVLGTPLIVGALTRWVAPPRRARGSVLRTALGGEGRAVVRVRMGRMASRLERRAFTVATPAAQKFQEPAQRRWEVLARHEREGTTRARGWARACRGCTTTSARRTGRSRIGRSVSG